MFLKDGKGSVWPPSALILSSRAQAPIEFTVVSMGDMFFRELALAEAEVTTNAEKLDQVKSKHKLKSDLENSGTFSPKLRPKRIILETVLLVVFAIALNVAIIFRRDISGTFFLFKSLDATLASTYRANRTTVSSYIFSQNGTTNISFSGVAPVMTEQAVKRSFRSLRSVEDFWLWVEGPLTNWLFPDTEYHQTFNRPIGAIRLRQLRVRAGSGCSVGKAATTATSECFAAYSATNEETTPYGTQVDGFLWEDEATLASQKGGSNKVYGSLQAYDGSGFIHDIPINVTRQSWTNTLTYYKRNNWIDKQTRAIVISFVIYNKHFDKYAYTKLLIEQSLGGEIIPSGSAQPFRIVSCYFCEQNLPIVTLEVFLVVAYILVLSTEIVKYSASIKYSDGLLRQFKEIRNLFDIATLVVFGFAIVFRVQDILLVSSFEEFAQLFTTSINSNLMHACMHCQ